MRIRKTEERDVMAAAEIYRQAREYMKQSGNPYQWPSDYPSEIDIRGDMENGIGYVLEDGGEVVAVFAFLKGPDPTYLNIYDGAWLSDEPYYAIHRIAVGKHGRGYADYIFNACLSEVGNVRIDTHRDNIPMQRVLARCGFHYCGVVYIETGDERIAFQAQRKP